MPLLGEDDRDLVVVVADGWRLCDLLVVLLLGVPLRLRPRRYSSAGLRKIPDPAPIMSVLVASSEDAVPVTGSQRRFSIKIGLVR